MEKNNITFGHQNFPELVPNPSLTDFQKNPLDKHDNICPRILSKFLPLFSYHLPLFYFSHFSMLPPVFLVQVI